MRHLSLLGLIAVGTAASADEPVRLVEKSTPDTVYQVYSTAVIDGYLMTPVAKDRPPERIKISGKSQIDYSERILRPDPREADHKSLRVYERIDFRKTAGDRTDEMTLRPAIRRLVMMKRGKDKLPFSPDGPLMWGEIEMLRTDFIVPALTGMLSDRAVRPGDTWKASTGAIVELTDMEKVVAGELECKLEKVDSIGTRRVAEVSFDGTVSGVDEDGPVKHKLTGKLLVDLSGQCISYIKINGERFLLDGDGKEAGKITGKLELSRVAGAGSKALSDAAIKALDLNPSEENTCLLYDSAETGVSFIHPRNWRVVRTGNGQMTLDDTNGAGLLITLSAADTVPATRTYLGEAQKDLDDRKASVTARTGPERIVEGVDRFTLDADLGKERVTMAYFVIRQEQGGATFAARIPAAHKEARLKELEKLARTFKVTRRLDGK